MLKTREQQEEEMLRNLSSSNISVLNDVFFKFVFGSEKRKAVTIEFLSAVLAKSGISAVKDLTFINIEKTPDRIGGKLTRFDVACTLDTGENVDIEVQLVNKENMQQRTLYYWARLYTCSLEAGDDYRALNPAITVNILDFNLLPHEAPHSVYRIYNQDDREEEFFDDLRLHFIEIPKYRRQPGKPVAKQSRMERWMSYLAGKLNDQERKDLAAADPAFAKAFAAADEFLRDKSQALSYVSRQMEILDYNTNIAAAKEEGEAKGRAEGRAEGRKEGRAEGRKEGRAEGRKEGRAEGIAEGKSEVVTNLLNMGFDISSISKATGWPAEQILAFAQGHNLPVKQ